MAGRNPGNDRSDEFLDALEEIFQKEGCRRVTITELASRLRCSRRAFYELAATKEELFLLILDRLLTRVRRLGDEAMDGPTLAGEQLEAYLEPGFTETLQASTAFFADIESIPAASRMMDRHQATRAEGIRRIIEEGIRQGQLRRVNPYLIGEAARVVARRLKEPEFLRESSLSAGDGFREWTSLLLHGLLHPAAACKKRPSRTRRR